MINKEERELIEKLQKGDKTGIYELIRTFKREGIENFITTRRKYIDIMINLIKKQENRIKKLEEINAEHQKLNGELQQRITELEEICTGKSIQELGVSKLYESNELREQIEEAKKRGWNDITVEVDTIDRILG